MTVPRRRQVDRVDSVGAERSRRAAILRADLAAGLVASLLIAGWASVSVIAIQGAQVWFARPEYALHLALIVVCMLLSAYYATRLHGSLDEKLAQSLTTVIAVFGLLALAILSGRFFYSRPLLLASFGGAVCASALVVFFKHRMAARNVAIIAPLVGNAAIPADLGEIVDDPQVDLRPFDVVLVSLSEPVTAEWSRALSRAMLAGSKVRHIGEYVEELHGAVSLDHFEIDHLPTDGIASYRALKRALDIILALVLAPVALPLVAASSLLILCTMGRPIFFRQARVGLAAKPFVIWKLRTMRPERPGEERVAAVVGDQRVTSLGRVLRRLRIDELPQLWNVLKGEMSLVGPRPEAVWLHDNYASILPNYSYRHLVRPGITGWAQVSVRPSASVEEARYKLTYDLFYVKKVSLYLDLLIMLRTVWTVLTGGGAR